MKRTLSFMVMALALLLTQCRKPEVKFPSPVAPEGTTVSMTVTAGPGSKTDITAEGAITWSTGDKLYVGFNGKYVGCLTLQGAGGSATGTFSGDVTLPNGTTGDQTFGFFYLGRDNGVAPSLNATTVAVSFATQEIYDNSGKLKNASKHHVGYGSAKGTVAGSEVTGINVTLVSKVALAHFSFKKNSTDYEGELTLSGTNIYNSMTVGFNGSFNHGATPGNITLTAGHGERYVMLVPTGATETQTLTFTGSAEDGTGDVPGLQSNKFYGKTEPIAVTLTASAPTHETVNFGNPNLNWSKYNLGVDPAKLTNAWDWYGDYYAWGEVVPYYTSLTWTSATTCTVNGWNTEATLGGGGTVNAYKGYAWQSYSHGSTSFTEWNVSPCTGSVPFDDYKKLKPARDAATQAWGEGWRMPTKEEWQSLYDNNTFEWLDAGAPSTKVTSFTAVAAGNLIVKGGKNSIDLDASVYMFLPAAGGLDGTGFFGPGSAGHYWASSLYAAAPESAYRLNNTKWGTVPQSTLSRWNGLSVRPVR